ncbi:glycine cleavage system aminomethyltransferase GcvT [Symmachiella dynata]|uniref:glycine cleavage system aminomethyltransferase GcvT n=1 Tax=Symmachiella dynata TaxID=2527995 RepID=UPI0011A62B14|nr:glycine cleavage system aminomethyltransferase GcvT [Symmachiella dynata]
MNETACHAWHVAAGGRMVDFAGWDMPVQYSTIIDEHNAVRQAAGLFDIAHMGRIYFRGPDAAVVLDSIVTNDVISMEVGQVRYALVTNAAGGILDDVLVYRFPDFYLLVVNASNREKIVEWIEKNRDEFDVEVDDATLQQFMLAIQGPLAVEILSPHVPIDLAEMGYYTAVETSVLGHPGLVSRTGYTGEDGFEVIVSNEQAVELWETLIADGKEQGLLPAGLGCRDTLRLEAAMPLYGHELNEQIDPYTAGLGFAVKLDAGDFIGQPAVAAAKEKKDRRKRVGLELEGRRIAREGAELILRDATIGEVTSGTFSPTLQKSIAMGYIDQEQSAVGTVLEVDIRGKRALATVVPLPFYKRA